jgi:hypothetical protein
VGSTVFFDSASEIATISASFTVAGVPADPTTVTCLVTDPSGAQVIHTYQGAVPADIAKVTTGSYTLDVSCVPSVAGIEGLWSYAFIGTGTASDVQAGTWRVLALDQARWYVGPEELKDRMGETGTATDSVIESVCLATSRWIDRYCGRHFFRMTDVRTYPPDSLGLLTVDDIVSVTTLKVDNDGDGIYEQTWTQNVNYQLRIADGQYNQMATGEAKPYTQVQVIGGSNFFPFIWPYVHLDRVQITGVFGWPQVPPAVTQAALIIASDWFKLKDAPWGVAGIADVGVIRVQSNPWIHEQLRPYCRPRGKVGV